MPREDDTLPPMDMEAGYLPYAQRDPESYKDIVIQQINECRIQLSKYLTEGGVFLVRQRGGASIPKIIEDQWEVNERCVEQLYDLMLYAFDDEAEERFEDIESEREEKKEKIIERYIILENDKIKRDLVIKTNNFVSGPNPSAAENYTASEMRYLRNETTRLKYQELLLLFKRKNDLSRTRKMGAYE